MALVLGRLLSSQEEGFCWSYKLNVVLHPRINFLERSKVLRPVLDGSTSHDNFVNIILRIVYGCRAWSVE